MEELELLSAKLQIVHRVWLHSEFRLARQYRPYHAGNILPMILYFFLDLFVPLCHEQGDRVTDEREESQKVWAPATGVTTLEI